MFQNKGVVQDTWTNDSKFESNKNKNEMNENGSGLQYTKDEGLGTHFF